MTSKLAALSPFVLAALGVAALAQSSCSGEHAGGVGPTTGTGRDGGAGAVVSPGSGSGTGQGGAVGSGSGTGTAGTSIVSTGAAGGSIDPNPTGAAGGGGTSVTIGGPGDGTFTPAGICPKGFVVCSGVCLEASLMGPNCHPLSCGGAEGATAPTRTTLSARGFDWTVTGDAAGTTVTFKGGTGGGVPNTIGVDLTYRANGTQVTTAPMTMGANGSFTWQSNTVKAGDDLEFFFHTMAAAQTIIGGLGGKPLIDTMWFHQIVGQAREPEPAYPLTTKLAGRFRDRHPNEERYDHFVDTYFAGPTFDLTFVDHGNALDVTIAPQASMNVQAVDFKNYECTGSGQGGALPAPTPMCSTPPALACIGVRAMAMGNSVWTAHVGNLSYGQLVDFELTFVRSRTYYTEWFSYYVGSGRLQPKIQHPWATAAGYQSVTNVTTDEFGYAQHIPNLTPVELANFISGKVLFEADFDTHVGYNPATTYDCPRGSTPGTKIPTIVTPPVQSPLFTAGNSFTNLSLMKIARPGDTASACFSCHHLDGKGLPPDDKGMGSTLLKLFSANGAAAGPDPMYGTILDQRHPGGGAAEVQAAVTWQPVPGQFKDGTPFELRKPVLTLGSLRDGALSPATHVSPRIPRPVFGMGFLEAVAPETILALADPSDANADGVSGRPNFVTDPVTGAQALGRFGWKAGTASLREQAALAFVNDIGVTSPMYPKHHCGPSQTACLSSVASVTGPQLTDLDLDNIQSYLRGLSVPPRRNYDDPKAIAGKAIFAAIGCTGCHVPNLVTSSTYAVPELRGIPIQPFTDLLLHDMGPGLADDAPVEEGSATGSEWRTAPLWGNGTGTAVMFPAIDAFDPNNHPPPGGVYLHDGRARSITEAILWHGGEAQARRDAFVALSAEARANLLAYVAYPFADPVPVRRCVGAVNP